MDIKEIEKAFEKIKQIDHEHGSASVQDLKNLQIIMDGALNAMAVMFERIIKIENKLGL